MQLRIDALQTVTPRTVTGLGRSRQIAVSGPSGAVVLQSRTQVVLYYGSAGDGDDARAVAAWIKESLSAALPEDPVLAGRLRPAEDGRFEVRSNDAGVRLVQATAVGTTMARFLGTADRDSSEGQLAYWVDVDAKDPSISALFFIQVTEFDGDGYSIGISCSLLLADPLFLARFLNKWVKIHNQMQAQGLLAKSPIFNLSYFRRPGGPTSTKLTSPQSTTTAAAATMFFKVGRTDTKGYNDVAAVCFHEAARSLEGKPVVEFSMIVSNHSGNLTVESCCDVNGLSKNTGVVNGDHNVVPWSEFGLEEMTLYEGNKPVHVSCCIISSVDHGLVVAMLPSDRGVGDSEPLISVTIPLKI